VSTYCETCDTINLDAALCDRGGCPFTSPLDELAAEVEAATGVPLVPASTTAPDPTLAELEADLRMPAHRDDPGTSYATAR